jgi:hypothetical protein
MLAADANMAGCELSWPIDYIIIDAESNKPGGYKLLFSLAPNEELNADNPGL